MLSLEKELRCTGASSILCFAWVAFREMSREDTFRLSSEMRNNWILPYLKKHQPTFDEDHRAYEGSSSKNVSSAFIITPALANCQKRKRQWSQLSQGNFPASKRPRLASSSNTETADDEIASSQQTGAEVQSYSAMEGGSDFHIEQTDGHTTDPTKSPPIQDLGADSSPHHEMQSQHDAASAGHYDWQASMPLPPSNSAQQVLTSQQDAANADGGSQYYGMSLSDTGPCQNESQTQIGWGRMEDAAGLTSATPGLSQQSGVVTTSGALNFPAEHGHDGFGNAGALNGVCDEIHRFPGSNDGLDPLLWMWNHMRPSDDIVPEVFWQYLASVHTDPDGLM